MSRSGSRSVLFLAALFAIAVGVVSSPARAQQPEEWTKLFLCTNAKAPAKHGIEVTLVAAGGITAQYADPDYPSNPNAPNSPPALWWSPGEWQYAGQSTVIKYPGSGLPQQPSPPPYILVEPRCSVTIGWTTASGDCCLSNICWRDENGRPGPTFRPTQLEGVNGGGVAFYNWPEDGDLTVAITNDLRDEERDDSRLGLSFRGAAYAISRVPLPMQYLYRLLSDGFCEESVDGGDVLPASVTRGPRALSETVSGASATDVAEGIRALREKVAEDGPPAFTEALLGHLDRAANAVDNGLRFYYRGNRAPEGASSQGAQLPPGSGQPVLMYALNVSGSGETDSQEQTSAPTLYHAAAASEWLPRPADAPVEVPGSAQAWWLSAARSIQAFVDGVGELPTAVLPVEVRDRWLVRDEHADSGTLGPTASRVLADLSALCEDRLMLQGHSLTSLQGPEGWGYGYRPIEGSESEYVSWSSIVDAMAAHSEGERLYPRHYTEIVIPGPLREAVGVPTIPEGGALIIRGELEDDEGNKFKWLEQIVAAEPPARPDTEDRGQR